MTKVFQWIGRICGTAVAKASAHDKSLDKHRTTHTVEDNEVNIFYIEHRTANMVFVRLRVAHTNESDFNHSLQLSQIFVPCALLFASIAGVCIQLHIDTLLRDIKGLSGELLQEGYLASWMGHFGTETMHSLFDHFSLSNSGSTLHLTTTLLFM